MTPKQKFIPLVIGLLLLCASDTQYRMLALESCYKASNAGCAWRKDWPSWCISVVGSVLCYCWFSSRKDIWSICHISSSVLFLKKWKRKT